MILILIGLDYCIGRDFLLGVLDLTKISTKTAVPK